MWAKAFAAAVVVSQVSAGVVGSVGQLVRRDRGLEETMRRYVDSIIEPVVKRQTPSVPSMNVTQWDAQTTTACTTALEALNGQASNPSGMAVCYNLPFLNDTTGVFQADLRLYVIGAPTGDFANIASQNVNVGLSYNGATVSAVNASSLGKREAGDVSLISWPRGMEKRQQTIPTMAQAYAFVGQVNPNLLAANMGTAALQKVLVPTVSLTAVNATGQTVNTTLSSQEATFVNGVFSTQVVPTKSQVQPPIQTLVVASASPFVVPGMTILIFPIGAIITGVWTILFLATIAYGTVGRMQFRDQFRRRTERATKGNTARI
ncbi:hypothetical protein BJ875DRAFT_243181 [Amylocarpus encephaloides]|uniref:Uncharacterized protein n=1 Tax=Amylocarpus encephaloides TaxID=45428 RepID=A0A9P8BZX6_9HELO|nr:hypothetical protein BJ875DRAFT_243181 [Amylocarpus encephaloides]